MRGPKPTEGGYATLYGTMKEVRAVGGEGRIRTTDRARALLSSQGGGRAGKTSEAIRKREWR